MAYASKELFKSYAGVDVDADDALIERLLESAQAMVDNYCRRRFEAVADSTRFFGAEHTNGNTLWLDRDLCQITGIVNGDNTALTSSDYRIQPRNAIDDGVPIYAIELTNHRRWHVRDGDVAITGRWAYSVEPPADIVQATIRLASYLYRQKDAGGDLDRPVLVSMSMTILPAALPRDLMQALDSYRRKTVTA